MNPTGLLNCHDVVFNTCTGRWWKWYIYFHVHMVSHDVIDMLHHHDYDINSIFNILLMKHFIYLLYNNDTILCSRSLTVLWYYLSTPFVLAFCVRWSRPGPGCSHVHDQYRRPVRRKAKALNGGRALVFCGFQGEILVWLATSDVKQAVCSERIPEPPKSLERWSLSQCFGRSFCRYSTHTTDLTPKW